MTSTRAIVAGAAALVAAAVAVPVVVAATSSGSPSPAAVADPACTWDGSANQQFPCAADTGVPAGTTLSTSCPTTVTASVTGCSWSGGITVTGSNITITNSRICGASGASAINFGSGTNRQVSYVTIDYGCHGPAYSGRSTASACEGDYATQGSNYVLDRSQVLGWSDGPRLGANMTLQNNFMEQCGLESRGDHSDEVQCYECGDGDVITHNTMTNGASGYSMSSADVTFAADSGYGSTWTNNFVLMGSGEQNSNAVGIDNRVDSGGLNKGTLTVTGNVFEGIHGAAVSCGAGPKAPNLTVIIGDNTLTSGANVSTPSACGATAPTSTTTPTTVAISTIPTTVPTTTASTAPPTTIATTTLPPTTLPPTTLPATTTTHAPTTTAAPTTTTTLPPLVLTITCTQPVSPATCKVS